MNGRTAPGRAGPVHRTALGLAVAIVALGCGAAGQERRPPTTVPQPATPQGQDERAVAVENRRCFDCHGQQHIRTLSPRERYEMVGPRAGEPAPSDATFDSLPATRPELWIDVEGVYEYSVHRQITCVSCHPDCADLPHAYLVQPALCGDCHQEAVAEYPESAHGLAIANGSKAAATCADCHGAHDILPHQNPQSRTHKQRLPFTCARCHSNDQMMAAAHVAEPHAAEQYVDGMHGRALLGSGLVVAPSCNDCHGVHDIKRASDPASKIHRDNVPATCGTCHAGIAERYATSVHGKKLAEGDEAAPVCYDCHGAHDIVRPSELAFKRQNDRRCGECHEERFEHYRETFHGKAMVLGLPGVATCSDCHGDHDILPSSDPHSRLSDQNRLETCRKCHPRATENFAGYIAHGDHLNREEYPLLFWTFVGMTALLVSVFSFFGLHTLLWLGRALWAFVRDPQGFRAARREAATDPEVYVRFRPIERFLHVLVISSFLLLVATGMPLKFYDAEWSKQLVSYFGGLEFAATLHRVGAVITFAYFGIHLLTLLAAMVRGRRRLRDPATGRFSLRHSLRLAFGPDSMVPNLDDLRDFWAHQKWFFGRGPRPQFDKWTYWEKFDYFAVFWGVFIIGLSGLVLWFPEAFTRILPGAAINVALIVHSDEALLAAGFIFTIHFFNTHVRPEKFPMDTIMFSGRISRTEMLHERRRWYDRLQAAGKLDHHRLKDTWPEWKLVAHPLGFLAFLIGTVLLVLIVVTMSSYLVGGCEAGPG